MPSLFVFPTESDFYYSFELTNPDGTAYGGKLDITAYVSDTQGGAIITGMTPVACAEVGTNTGVYAGTFPAAASAQFITNQRWGFTGYLCVAEGSKVLASDRCIFRATCPATS